MIKLFYSPGSCALASLISMHETGEDFQKIDVDFSNNEQQSDDYLAINPLGRVPALITDEGTLTETPAILAYIAQRFPSAALAPTDNAFDFAKVQSFNSFLCSTAHINHAHFRRSYRWADEQSSYDDMARKVPETMGAAFDLVENKFLQGPWVMGDQYTICDPYLFTITRWLKGDGVPASRHPRVQEHMQRMNERAAVKAALA